MQKLQRLLALCVVAAATVHAIEIRVPSFVKSPSAEVVHAGDRGTDAHRNPFFVSDPAIITDSSGMHLVTTALFCSEDGRYMFSYDPTDFLRCNPGNTSEGGGGSWLYGFSADDGSTWEYLPTPFAPAGTAVWNDQKLETPNLVLVNDTLVIFYSSTGYARLQRFTISVATLALNGRSIRQAVLIDGDRPVLRAEPTVPADLLNSAALTNNAQEPTAILSADGQTYDLFFTGLGVKNPNDGLDQAGNAVQGVFFLRCRVAADFNLIDVPVEVATPGITGGNPNIVEVMLFGGEYHLFYTSLVLGGDYHHDEELKYAVSTDGGFTFYGHGVGDNIMLTYGPDAYDGWGIMAPTVALVHGGTELVMLYSAWGKQTSPCILKDQDRSGGVGVSRFGKPTTNVSVGAQMPNQDWCIMSNIGRAVSPFPFTATYDTGTREAAHPPPIAEGCARYPLPNPLPCAVAADVPFGTASDYGSFSVACHSATNLATRVFYTDDACQVESLTRAPLVTGANAGRCYNNTATEPADWLTVWCDAAHGGLETQHIDACPTECALSGDPPGPSVAPTVSVEGEESGASRAAMTTSLLAVTSATVAMLAW